MFVKLALFALFAAAVFASPVEEAEVSRAINELKARGILDQIKNNFEQMIEEESSSSNEVARSSNKKKMEMVVTLMLMFKAVLVPMIMWGLAIVSGKALLVSKVALVLGLILGIKKLLDTPRKVIIEEKEHGWGRSIDAQNLAYSAYRQ